MERRVRFTDDYVPGPEGCPVWMIEKTKIQSVAFFIRAENEQAAFDLYDKYYIKHEHEILKDLDQADPTYSTEIYYHADASYGWKE